MRLSTRQLIILEGSLLGDGFLARKKQTYNACFGVLWFFYVQERLL